MCKSDSGATRPVSLPDKSIDGCKPAKQRLKIWELPASYHCPVVGVCLPLAVLRRLVNKAMQGVTSAGDYDIHVGAVNHCAEKNRLSRDIQEELDRRYAQTIHLLRDLGTPSEILDYWHAAENGADVAGAFWATLTHPRGDYLIREKICKSMHMLQHQAGARTRIEHHRFEALANEHRILTTELGKAQTRCTELLAQKSSEIDKLERQLLEARSQVIRKDTAFAALQTDMAELQQATPDLPQRLEQKRRIAELTSHLQLRNRELALAQRTIEELRAKASEQNAPGDQTPQDEAFPDGGTDSLPPITLDSKTVLCVGGRTKVVARYRDCVESFGAHFSHHDGGVEDNLNQLDSTLAAADLVICQTGCISHNAYWRVKEHCKRTGKRCAFVVTPSYSSFSRILLEISVAAEKGNLQEKGFVDEIEQK